MCEALHRLRWQAYLETLSQDCCEAALKVAADLQSAFPEEKYQLIIESQVFNTILEGYDKFNKQQESKTCQFWSSYIEMVEDLLSFITRGHTRGKLGSASFQHPVHAAVVLFLRQNQLQ